MPSPASTTGLATAIFAMGEDAVGLASEAGPVSGTEPDGRPDWLSRVFGLETNGRAEEDPGKELHSEFVLDDDTEPLEDKIRNADEGLSSFLWTVPVSLAAWPRLTEPARQSTAPCISPEPALNSDHAAAGCREAGFHPRIVALSGCDGLSEGWAEALETPVENVDFASVNQLSGQTAPARDSHPPLVHEGEAVELRDLPMLVADEETTPPCAHADSWDGGPLASREPSGRGDKTIPTPLAPGHRAGAPPQDITERSGYGEAAEGEVQASLSGTRPPSAGPFSTTTARAGLRHRTADTGRPAATADTVAAIEDSNGEPSGRGALQAQARQAQQDPRKSLASQASERENPRGTVDGASPPTSTFAWRSEHDYNPQAAALSPVPSGGTLKSGGLSSDARVTDSNTQSPPPVPESQVSGFPGETVQRRLILQVEGGGQRVDIRLHQLPGLLRVNLSSQERLLAEQIQGDLASLHRSLQAVGWKAEVGVNLERGSAAPEGWISSPKRTTQETSGELWQPGAFASREDSGSPGGRGQRDSRQAVELHEEFLDLSAIRRMFRNGGI
ncbi:MAG: hypothetical protein KatS3mg004_1489 [Bryobacteraceae bacterium]|nr:MAG: hypothetical protein KatS3mg004_1489 [Bryobacteraceae bacterium]